MKILILGGNRFVGKLVAERLSKHNYPGNLLYKHDVTILNRSGTGPSTCRIIKCDRNDEKKLQVAIGNESYDCIIDMCLYNMEQAKKSIPIFETITKKYIFLSSIAYRYEFFGHYGKQKKLIEDYIRSSKLPYINLRPTYIIGEGDHTKRFQYYIDQILNNKPIPIDGSGQKLITFVDAQDVCKIICKLTKKKIVNESFEISNNEYTSLDDLTYRLAKIMGYDYMTKKLTLDSPEMAKRLGSYDDETCIANNFKIKKALKFKFKSLNSTIRRIYKNYEPA
jgi:nucleoside-diphosphate-sugar epimerase